MPKFTRQTYGIYKRIGDEWRKPKGRHSKLRHQSAGHMKKVKPGFGTNRIVKGLDRTGLIPVIIHSLGHISLLDKNKHGAIIGGNVGDRKRLLIIAELKKHGIKMLNLKEGHETKIHSRINERKQEKDGRTARKAKPAKEGKKDHRHDKEMTQEEKELHEKKEKDKIITKEQK